MSLLVGAALSGCVSVAPGILLPPDDPSVARLVSALEVDADRRRALRGQAKVRLDGPGLKLRRPQRLALERPARMRIEILGLFDQIAAVLVTNGRTYQFFDPGNGEVAEGIITPGLLWDLARIDLDPAQAVELLLGAVTPWPGLVPGDARRLEDGEVRIDFGEVGGGLAQQLRLDAEGRLAGVQAFGPDGKLQFEARYFDYRRVVAADGEIDFAHRIEISFPQVEAEASFAFKRVILEAELSDRIFELRLPPAKREG